MPGLDGLEATRAIRRREQAGPPTGRLPILILTANAMASVREECLAAGADGYASKPIDSARLAERIEALAEGGDRARRGPDARPADSPGGDGEPASGVDFAAALAHVDGDEEALCLLAGQFLDRRAEIEADLRRLETMRESDALAREMHKLKSSLSLLGLIASSRLAEQIEASAGESDWARTGRLMRRLNEQLEADCSSLHAYTKEIGHAYSCR
jgi:DNA-binding response OmpR family regulator